MEEALQATAEPNSSVADIPKSKKKTKPKKPT